MMNLQDAFLNQVRKQKLEVTIHVTNGYQINHATILGYDNFVILAECGGKQMLIYKHAVSTISPAQKVEMSLTKEQQGEL